jgi:hypothetical protein
MADGPEPDYGLVREWQSQPPALPGWLIRIVKAMLPSPQVQIRFRKWW